MALFGNIEVLVNTFLRELPRGMFPEDRADSSDPTKRSVSSSDVRAQMTVINGAYQNLHQIYDNKYMTTAEVASYSRWERDYFTESIDQSQPALDRKANLLAKKRANGGISFPAISAILDPIFANLGMAYDLVCWCGTNGGAWILDESQLDVSTYLSFMDPILGAGPPHPLDCNLDYAAEGLSAQDLIDIQTTAYRYEVRIHGTAPNDFLLKLDALLTKIEPARSDHYIYNSFPGPVAP